MPKKKVTELKFDEYYDCGVLSDESHICVRIGQSAFGPYEVVRDIPNGVNGTDPILADGFVNLETAKIRAWEIWKEIKKQEKEEK